MIAPSPGDNPRKRKAPAGRRGAIQARRLRTTAVIPLFGENVKHRWANEGNRLAEAYFSTGDERHRIAFGHHMGGMLQLRREVVQ